MAVALIVLGLVPLGMAACGGSVGYSDGSGDRVRGKELFIQGCGSCHTLNDAGTKGEIGPNLDYAFYESRRNGFEDSTIQQVVRGMIAYPTVVTPTGEPGMPADIFTGDDAEDVATYVASVAGLDLDAPPSPPAGGGGGGNGGDELTVGKQVFASAGCGSCHALADAGASGQVGPSLDEARPDRGLVAEIVTNGRGAMPAYEGDLSPEQIDAVAAYVSTVAGAP
jgi:mono/diheme cytochrome c family protein